METSKRVLGLGHPKTLTGMANLASTCQRQRRWKDAEELLIKVVDGNRTTFGEDHPSTVSAIRNLASLHQARSEYRNRHEFQNMLLQLAISFARVDLQQRLPCSSKILPKREKDDNLGTGKDRLRGVIDKSMDDNSDTNTDKRRVQQMSMQVEDEIFEERLERGMAMLLQGKNNDNEDMNCSKGH
jgi:hypothetical protein